MYDTAEMLQCVLPVAFKWLHIGTCYVPQLPEWRYVQAVWCNVSLWAKSQHVHV